MKKPLTNEITEGAKVSVYDPYLYPVYRDGFVQTYRGGRVYGIVQKIEDGRALVAWDDNVTVWDEIDDLRLETSTPN